MKVTTGLVHVDRKRTKDVTPRKGEIWRITALIASGTSFSALLSNGIDSTEISLDKAKLSINLYIDHNTSLRFSNDGDQACTAYYCAEVINNTNK